MRVEIVDQDVISFYSKHFAREDAERDVREIVRAHVCLVRRYLVRDASRTEADRTEAMRAELERVVGTLAAASKEEMGGLAKTIADFTSAVQTQLLGLIGSVERTVGNGVMASASQAVREHLDADLTRLAGCVDRLGGPTASIHAAVQGMCAKMDEMSRQVLQAVRPTESKQRGKQGEQRLFSLLSERLTSREDYVVELVSGIAHNCDINVRRTGYPDVRVESKAIGETTGEKVRACEVEKFRADLMSTNAHGIFVSLHSAIVGKGRVGIEQLPNGKLAVYLSNNEFDVDSIHDALVLIYHLDKRAGGSEAIRIAPETMQACAAHLSDVGQKLAKARTHAKETLAILNELSIDKVEQILFGGGDAACKPVAKKVAQQRAKPRAEIVATTVRTTDLEPLPCSSKR